MNNLEKAKQALQSNNGQAAGQASPQAPAGAYAPFPQQNSITGRFGTGMQKTILDFGKTIKSERAAKGWSQRQLAAASGYSQGTITRAENNMWVSLRCLFCIAEALGKKITLT